MNKVIRAAVAIVFLLSGVLHAAADDAAETLRILSRWPYLLPPEPAADVPIVEVQFAKGRFRTRLEPGPSSDRGSLELDRALASRATRRPDYWLLVTDSEGRVVYWLPVEDPRSVRAEVSGEDEGSPIDGRVVRLRRATSSLRVPLAAGQRIALYGWKGKPPTPELVFSLPYEGPPRLPVRDLLIGLDCRCTDVFQVRQARCPGEPLDLVFVPDGFIGDDELNVYRCAVTSLVDSLLALDPYDEYACRVNAFRIDLVGDQDVGIACSDAGCRTEQVVTGEWPNPCELGTAIHSRSADCDSGGTGFGTSLCYRDVCRLAWPSPDGQEALERLVSTCAPQADAVIVVANSTAKAGGGYKPVNGGRGLAVLTLPSSGKTAAAVNLLAHELGHAFGLLDEYVSANVDPSVLEDYACDRNVFTTLQEGMPCTDDVSWKNKPCSPPAITIPCSGPASIDGCHRVQGDSTGACDCDDPQDPVDIGLFEGAYYHACDFYRPSDECRMNVEARDFCSVCQDLLVRGFSDAGVARCTLANCIHPSEVELDCADLTVRGCNPPPCPEREWPYIRVRARVDREGVLGDVAIRSLKATVRQSDGAPLRQLEVRRGPGGPGVGRLEWTLDGVPIPPPVGGGPAPAGLGTVVGPVKVVDDVRGEVWRARKIFWMAAPVEAGHR